MKQYYVYQTNVTLFQRNVKNKLFLDNHVDEQQK